jgi:hypothetical protein
VFVSGKEFAKDLRWLAVSSAALGFCGLARGDKEMIDCYEDYFEAITHT